MREILFRGKRVDNGEWVYGVPTKDENGEMVVIESIFECDEYACRGAKCLYVDETTVGQCTLISIKPKYCELIANGKKTIEVRKSRPNIETPFKCYIYQTKAKQVEHCDGCDITYYGCGKVIGEFVCDEIIKDERGENADLFTKQAGLSLEEQKDYGKNKTLYGWHISDLKIYDKPKPIMQFYKPCPIDWKNCPVCEFYSKDTGACMNNIDRPPMSWCYVEEEE